MAKFEIGDLVVLTSGSMRMAVEDARDDRVAVVWCHEGAVGRDAFDPRLLRKWEAREEGGPRHDRGPSRDDRKSGGPRDDRKGPAKPPRDGGGRKPEGKGEKTGWDGKPREKKYFRKND